jgi:hypothetical protein
MLSTLSVRPIAGKGTFFEPNPATPTGTHRTLGDQFDTRPLKGLNDLDQGVHISAYLTITGLHSLNGWQGNTGGICQVTLIHPEQGAGSPHLRCSYHL